MADFKGIAENLRRQRRDLEQQFDDTGVSSAETTRLVDRIEKLRERMARSQPTGSDGTPDAPERKPT